ncbi:methionyl-tRNA formyltransferase, partial [bacterium]|nr:methionyl-tRNA formyltransferase [bacterium]
ILLTSTIEACYLAGILSSFNPDLSVVWVRTREELERAVGDSSPSVRLIAFMTEVVVPAEILKRLEGPAYNFHPGPPAYPGKYPSAFALYDGAAGYGATAHEMRPLVDSGP